MKIGILTFHWATNYGAVLQAYCLQEYLMELGHDVSIINYKPSQFDFSWFNFLKHPGLFKTLNRQLSNLKKEDLLEKFRKKYLNTTKRYFSTNEFGTDMNDYDILISGSDQVLNPNFTKNGENGNVSPVYWLQCGRTGTKRIGYAVSFGCEVYPKEVTPMVSQWVNSFATIGVREKSGITILKNLDYSGSVSLVPDPTILLGAKLYQKLGIRLLQNKKDYTCVYMLRHELHIEGNVRYIDEKHNPLTMEEWLTTIACASGIITNSYHGMLMAIFVHVPFVILLETGNNNGMNDRFITLSKRIGIADRLVNTKEEVIGILQKQMDFSKIDVLLSEFRREGLTFLKDNI